jgi:hypothetical protein
MRLPGRRDRFQQAGVEELSSPRLDRRDDARQVALADVGDVGRVAVRMPSTESPGVDLSVKRAPATVSMPCS